MGDGRWLLWRSSSARRTLVAVAGRRFGGAAVVDRQAKSGELWPLAIEETVQAASRPCHSIIGCKHIHFFILTRLVCPACIAISRRPSASLRPLSSTPALSTSHLSHVPQQLRQRLGHLVCANLIRRPSASAKLAPVQLAARPYLPGRICPRSC